MTPSPTLEHTSLNDKRLVERLPVWLPILLKDTDEERRLLTENLSIGGMFVLTDAHFRIKQRLQIKVPMPMFKDVALDLEAIVAHTLTAVGPQRGQTRSAGIGLTIEWPDDHTRALWCRFIDALARYHREHGSSRPMRLVPASDAILGAARRQHTRDPVRVAVILDAEHGRLETHTHDISAGGAFLLTETRVKIGMIVALTMKDPTSGARLLVRGAVVRGGRTPEGARGIGVAFDPMDGEELKALRSFIEGARREPEGSRKVLRLHSGEASVLR